MATFFVTGIAAYQSPRLLERIYAEGHEIGNHTYTHTDLEEMSPSQLKLELMLTQRLIQSRLGVSTRLFRPPYGVDEQAVSSGGLNVCARPATRLQHRRLADRRQRLGRRGRRGAAERRRDRRHGARAGARAETATSF